MEWLIRGASYPSSLLTPELANVGRRDEHRRIIVEASLHPLNDYLPTLLNIFNSH